MISEAAINTVPRIWQTSLYNHLKIQIISIKVKVMPILIIVNSKLKVIDKVRFN